MTGTIVYLPINHLISEDHLINTFMSLKSANITIKKQEKDVINSVYFHIPHLNDYIIHINIRQIFASSF